MNQALIAIVSAAVIVFPAYLLGGRIRGKRTWYLGLFYGTLVIAAAGLAAALIGERRDLAAVAIGVAFGAVNGLRYGFTRPFAGLRPHTDQQDR